LWHERTRARGGEGASAAARHRVTTKPREKLKYFSILPTCGSRKSAKTTLATELEVLQVCKLIDLRLPQVGKKIKFRGDLQLPPVVTI